MKTKYLFLVSLILTTFLNAQENSLQFSGQEVLRIENPDLTDYLDDRFTIEVVFNQTTKDPVQTIFNYSSKNKGIRLFTRPNGDLIFRYNTSNYVIPGYSVSINKCSHISIVKRDSMLSFYVDGILAGSSFILDTNTIMPSNVELSIGARSDLSQGFIGEIDELRFHNDSKDSSYISNNVYKTLEDTNGLRKYYNFNEVFDFVYNYPFTTPLPSIVEQNCIQSLINVINCGTPDACNLVINGDFEEFSQPVTSHSQIQYACNWFRASAATPDYYNANSTNPAFSVPNNSNNYLPDNIPGNSAYAGGAIIPFPLNSIYETIETRLASPLQANTIYELSFDVAKRQDNVNDIVLQAFLSEVDLITVGSGDLPTFQSPNGILLEDLSNPITAINSWQTQTFQFSSGLGGQEFLYLGGISNATVYNNGPGGGFNYYFIDNVVLKEIQRNDDILLSFCENDSIVDLTNYLGSVNTGGTFTSVPPGAVTSAGVFDPSIGQGVYDVTYEYTDSLGCLSTLIINITVTPPCSKPYISQVFEDDMSDYIEIKNPDLINTVAAGTYYLVYYANNTPINGLPTATIDLGTLAPEQAIYFRTATSTPINDADPNFRGVLPAGFNDFNADNDILILTTAEDTTAYLNRIDLAGEYGTNWGQAQTLLRSSCALQYPRTDAYEVCDWASVTLAEAASAEFNQASNTNVVLGRHYTDPLSFVISGDWQDNLGVGLSAPDHSREVQIQADYDTATNGSFQACSILVEAAFNTLTINPLNYVRVQNNVDVEASASIDVQNRGSLVMVHDACYGIVGPDLVNLGANNGINVSAETLNLDAPTDYVFWSTPLTNNIQNSTVEEMFPLTAGFNPSRFFIYRNENHFDHFSGAGYPQTGIGADGFDDTAPFDYIPLTTAERNLPMIPGLGYATWPPTTTGSVYSYTVNFVGQANNGVVTVPVYRNDSSDGVNYNLIGNPYPSPISLDRLFDVNQNLIDPVAYIWSSSGDPDPNNPGPLPVDYTADSFLVYTNGMTVVSPFVDPANVFNSDRVASCQSFFVQTITDQTILPEDNSGDIVLAGDLIFNNSMRTTQPNNSFARMANTNAKNSNSPSSYKLWLNLTNQNQTLGSQIGVAFKDGASTSFNSREDVKVPYGRAINFYSRIANADLIINNQDAFDENKEISLGYTQLEGDQSNLVISIDKTEGFANQTIYLEDHLLNVVHNLSNGDYIFTSEKGVFDNRFTLKFTDSVTTNKNISEAIETVSIYGKDGKLIIKSLDNKNIKQVLVNDIYTARFGYEIANKNEVNQKEVSLQIGNNYRLIQIVVVLEDGTRHAKKLLL